MKFSLAVALSHNADFIILDEPTSGLDPVFRRELLEVFSELIQDERKSILFSTHITSDLERIADYITFINDGIIVFSLVFLAVLAICIFLPFIYRFGLMGIMIALAAGVVFLTLGVAMGALLKSPALKDSVVARVVKSVLSRVFSGLEGSDLPGVLEKAISNLGMPLFVVLISLIMIVLLFVSSKISVYIFNKKEL